MSLISWKPRTLCMDGPRWADSFFQNNEHWPSNWAEKTCIPAVNIVETENAFILEVAAPGMQKKDFNVYMDGGMLIIDAQSARSNEGTGDRYTRKEFSHTSFTRSFWMPENVIVGAISAVYENGLLTVHLQKK